MNEDLSGTQSIYADHEIVRFKVGEEIDGEPGDYTPIDAPAHQQYGIVTRIETEEEVSLARVYSSDGRITGNYLARPDDVRGYDKEALIDRFALFDESFTGEEHLEGQWVDWWEDNREENDLVWGDYECLARVHVPDDAEFYVSDTTRFESSNETWPIGEDLEGGTLQFELIDPEWGNSDSDKWNHEDRLWVSMGSIDSFTTDNEPRDFEDVWDQADKGENMSNTEACTG